MSSNGRQLAALVAAQEEGDERLRGQAAVDVLLVDELNVGGRGRGRDLRSGKGDEGGERDEG